MTRATRPSLSPLAKRNGIATYDKPELVRRERIRAFE